MQTVPGIQQRSAANVLADRKAFPDEKHARKAPP